MKPSVLLSATLLLGGCYFPNPFFALKDGPEGSSTEPDATSSSSSNAPTTSGSSSSESGSTMPVEPSSESGLDTMMGTSSGNMDPSTTSSTGSSSGSSSDSGSSSSSDSGNLGDVVWDLYALCPEAGVEWLGGSNLNIPFECNQLGPPSADQIPKLLIEGMEETSILDLTPTDSMDGAVQGSYPLNLKNEDIPLAKFKAQVVCPTSPEPAKPCEATADLIVTVFDVPKGIASVLLKDGDSADLELQMADLADIEGNIFEAILKVSVGDKNNPHNHVYFVHPRITLE